MKPDPPAAPPTSDDAAATLPLDISESAGAAGLSNPDEWIDRHGDALFRFALLHLRDQAAAEDAVQECLLAALAARDRFAGQASERTWLVGILKRKVIDHLRRRNRERTATDDAAGERIEAAAFTDRGFWRGKLAAWGGNPADVLENREFWEVLQRCLESLPAPMAEAFLLCTLEDLPGPEACQVLNVTATNLWARLHRARLGLRKCLDAHWFRPAGRKS